MNHSHLPILKTLASCLMLGSLVEVRAEDDLFLDRVVPVLQRRCLSCHNDNQHKGDFSFQTAKSAFSEGYIEAGDSAASHLIDMITPIGGKAKMPKDSDPLSAAEISAIAKWIDDGARWPAEFKLTASQVTDLNWWSLRPLREPVIPARWNLRKRVTAGDNPKEGMLKHELQLRTPIDAFVQEKLTEKGLTAAPEADRLTLIRRIYFDLIGLPPTPSAVESFLDDEEPQAYERLVDRLLASKRYGERWARHWLDVVHYADTHGYDKDKPRPNAWPYRDYVIRSLNADKPYGRFVMEQIAGDALWPDSVDGVTATGFIAAGPWDYIGHAEVPETKIDGRIARHLDRDDMVTSVMNTFCSTTVQCARCHNHKFDPVTQEHYYSLQSVFAALDRADHSFDTDPQTAARRVELKKREAELALEKAVLATKIEKAAGKELTDIDAELALLEKQKNNKAGALPEFGYHSRIEPKAEIEKWVQVDLGKATLIASIIYVGCHDTFAGIGHGFGFPVRYKIEVSEDVDFESGNTVVVDHTAEDVTNPGTKPQNVTLPDGLKARYVRVTATKLAQRKNDFIFSLAEILAMTPDGQNAALEKQVTALDSIEAPVRWQRKNLVDGYYYGVSSQPDGIARVDQLKNERKALLNRTLGDDLKARIAANREAADATTAALKALPPQEKVYAGTVHHGKGSFVGTGASGGKPRTVHVLHRGNILQPREEVGPGAIPVIANVDWHFSLPPSHKESARRVALARWLVHRENPLTWRSIVNRVWQYHFGRGIVETSNDFGRMGQQPSHPELLDWLAVEFRDGGQSLKKLHKLIVTSSVYRQSSEHHERNSLKDSSNVYFWRMNRRRLTAEEVRDAVLSVSGKLNLKMYGPGFQMFVIEHPQHSPHYEYDRHDPDDTRSHRRSIYRFIVRSQPDPFMTTLDCADSSQSVARREETVTALQALSLLNNKFMLRMAEHFSERVGRESNGTAGQIEIAFQLVTGHRPSKEQQAVLVRYASKYGRENLCRLLMNMNEFVFVD